MKLIPAGDELTPVEDAAAPSGAAPSAPAPAPAASSPAPAGDLMSWTRSEAARIGVPVDVAERLIRTESGGRAGAISPKGAFGPAQLMPGTAADLQRKYGGDPSNPQDNITLGLYYLRDNIQRFGGDVQKGVAAYHAGPGAVAKAGGIPDTHDGIMATRDYTAKIAGNGGAAPAAAPTPAAAPAARLIPAGMELEVDTGAAPTPTADAAGAIPTGPSFAAIPQRFNADALRTAYAMKPAPASAKPAPVEKTPGAAEQLWRGTAAGVLGLAEDVGTALQWVGGRLGADSMQDFGKTVADYWEQAAKPYAPSADIRGSIVDNPGLLANASWWAYNVANTAPSLLASIVPGFATGRAIQVGGQALAWTPELVRRLAIVGGSLAAGGVGGSLEGAQTYKEVLNRGGGEQEAALAAAQMTLASGALNALSFGTIATPGKMGALYRFLASGATEALTEWAEGPAEAAILQGTSVGEPEGRDAIGQRALEELNVAPVAFVLGGAAGAVGGSGRAPTPAPQPPAGSAPSSGAPPGGQPSPQSSAPLPAQDLLGTEQPAAPSTSAPAPTSSGAQAGQGAAGGAPIAPAIDLVGGAAQPPVVAPPADLAQNAPAAPNAPPPEAAIAAGAPATPSVMPGAVPADQGQTPPEQAPVATVPAFSPAVGDRVLDSQGDAANIVSIDGDTATLKGPEGFEYEEPVSALQPLDTPKKQRRAPTTEGPALGTETFPDVTEAVAPETPTAEPETIAPESETAAAPAPTKGEQLKAKAQAKIKSDVDADAHQAATSPANETPEPTEAQKKAGNYEKGHTTVAGLSIAIENPEGSTRSGTGADGKPWSVTMRDHYGYVKRTEGADGDQVDVFVKAGTPADYDGPVFVVDQVDPATGKFDEHKVMLGWPDSKAARDAYLANYSKGWQGLKSIAHFDLPKFREWLRDGDLAAPALDWISEQRRKTVAEATEPKPDKAKIIPTREGVKVEPETAEQRHARAIEVARNMSDATLELKVSRGYADEIQRAEWERRKAAKKSAEPVNVITFPSGRAGYVGKVPDELAFVDGATPEQIANAKKFGEQFGPKRRTFDSMDEAKAFAEARGYTVNMPTPAAPAAKQDATAPNARIVAGTHTKTGKPIWTVVLDVRVGRDAYDRINARAKELGGRYSSFKGRGAVPGFIFDSEDKAKALMPAVRAEMQLVDTPAPTKGDALKAKVAEKMAPAPDEAPAKATPEEIDAAEERIVQAMLADPKFVPFLTNETNRVEDVALTVQRRFERETLEMMGEDEISPQVMDALLQQMKNETLLLALTRRMQRLAREAEGGSARLGEGDGKPHVAGMKPAAGERLLQAGSTDADQGADLAHTQAGAVKRPSGVNVERQGAASGTEDDAAPTEGGLDIGPRYTEFLADLRKRHPGLVQGLGSLDVEGQRAVKALVLGAVKDFEIRRGVVKSIPVAVMNRFVGREASPQLLLGNPAVLTDALAAVDPSADVFADFMAALVRPSAPRAAEIPSAGVAAPNERDAAVKAGQGQQDWGASNKVFTSEAAEEARRILRSKLGTLNTGIDPEVVRAGITLAGFHVEAGARSFAAYTERMVADLGGAVRPYLKSWYLAVRNYPGFDRTGMQSEAELEAADVFADARPAAQNEPTEAPNAGQPGRRPDGEDGAAREGAAPVSNPETQGATGNVRPGPGADDQRGGDGGDRGNAGEPGVQEGTLPGPREAAGGSATQRPGGGDRGGARVSGRRGADNYRISPGDANAVTRWDRDVRASWFEKARRNVEALEVLKRLEDEARQATPEEQEALSRFVGWGASELAQNLFPPRGRPVEERWQKLQDRLRAATTEEEYDKAARSTQYAHYTSREVIQAMWSALDRLGFQGGYMLEPGMGVGLFPIFAPDHIAANGRYVGIEFEPGTAAIAKHLLPQYEVRNEDYTKSRLPDAFFDVAIGNPPFGDIPIRSDPKFKAQGFLLHDYFFAKTLDKVRPGGIVAFVTSNGTMDKADEKARRFIGRSANLIGAIRLPNTAFGKNAGTEVVTDIIFLQKKGDGVPEGAAWTESVDIETRDGPARVNEYYAAHPDMVLGVHRRTGTMYGANQYTVEPSGNLADQLAAAIQRLPEGIFKAQFGSLAHRAKTEAADFSPEAKKEGNYYVKDGNLYQVEGGVGLPVQAKQGNRGTGFTKKQVALLRDFVPLREATRAAMYDQTIDGPWEKSLEGLRAAYATFTKKHGPVNQFRTKMQPVKNDEGEWVKEERRVYPLLDVIKDDPDWTLVAALERVDEDLGEIREGDALKERVIFKPRPPKIETPADALFTVLNETGHVDIPAIAALLNQSEDQVIAELGDSIYENPQSRAWETADEYLSGKVKAKLQAAVEAARIDPKYERNAKALEGVQPQAIPPSSISVKLGVPFVSADDVSMFLRSLGLPADVKHSPKTATWAVVASGRGASGAASTDWGTPKMTPYKIAEAALNFRTIKIYDHHSDGTSTFNAEATEAANQKLAAMNDKFESWVWEDAERASRIADTYNDIYNDTVPRRFNGDHLTLPGVSATVKLRPHQKRAIWRILQQGNTYIAHAVGAGKTMEMVAAGMEMRRLGLASKPMYAVPNHMLKQFAREMLQLYPAAKIMVADEKSFDGDKRRLFIARAAASDLDAVIITHSAIEKLDVKQDVKDEIIREELAALEEVLEDTPKNERVTRKMIEKQKQRAEQRLAKNTSDAGKDTNLTFEDLGVDFLLVDEAHAFRKLSFSTNQGTIKGVDPSGSERAFAMYLKTRALEKRRPGRSFVFASGTPIVNTLGEMYTLMRFFTPDEMVAKNMERFDAWAALFGRINTAIESNAAGNYGPVTRFSRFVNLPELIKTFLSFADIITSDQLGSLVSRPTIRGGHRQIQVTPRIPELEDYQKSLKQRIAAIKARKGKPVKGQDILLNVINDGRLSSIDMRFVRPGLPANPDSKLNRLIADVIKAYKDTADVEYTTPDGTSDPIRGATQMVFADLGLGEAASLKFDMRRWMMQKFAEAGIPREHVAFMSNVKSSDAKLNLFRQMNTGQVRILIGGKDMETGVNAQRRLIRMSHLDAPWFPASMEQREGRILRQGNLNPEVEIDAYATKGSYDTTMWQLLATKQRFIDQVMSGDLSIRSMEDLSEADQYTMATALTSGDERAIQLAGLQADIQRLERLRRAHADQRYAVKSKIDAANWNLEWLNKLIPQYEQDVARAKPIGGDAFRVKVGSTEYTKRAEAGAALIAAMKPLMESGHLEKVKLAEAGGFDVVYDPYTKVHPTTGQLLDYLPRLGLDRTGRVTNLWSGAKVEEADPQGLAQRIVNAIDGLAGDLAKAQADREDALRERAQLEPKLNARFEFEQILADKVQEANALEATLAAEGKAAEAAERAAAAVQQPGAAPPVAEMPTLPYDAGNNNRIESGQEPDPNETKSLSAGERQTRAADVLRRYRGTVLGRTLSGQFEQAGAAALVGQRIGNAGDLAALAQVYRNPYFETLRYFHVRNGVIVGATGVSARMPDVTTAFPFPHNQTIEQGARWLRQQFALQPGDQLFMLHNHPSGLAAPSEADVDLTKALAAYVPQIGGHVVIDTNEYAVITPMGRTLVLKRDFGAGDPTPAVPHPMLGRQLRNYAAVYQVGIDLHKTRPSDYAVLIALDHTLHVSGLMEVPQNWAQGRERVVAAQIRRFAKQTGAVHVVAAGVRPDLIDTHPRVRDMIRTGLLTDLVDINGRAASSALGVTRSALMRRGMSVNNEATVAREPAPVIVESVTTAFPAPPAPQGNRTTVTRERLGGPVDVALRMAGGELLARVTSKLYDRTLAFMGELIPERVKAGFIADYGEPAAAVARREEMFAAIQARYRAAETFVDKLRGLSRAESRVAYAWMTTADPAKEAELMAQLPAESRAVLTELKELVDDMGREAVDLGLLERETYERWRMAYLHRTFYKYELQQPELDATKRKRAIKVLGDQFKGRGMRDDVDMARILWPEGEPGISRVPGKVDTSLKGKKFIRLEQRTNMDDSTMTLPGVEEVEQKGKLLRYVYWPEAFPIPPKYQGWLKDEGTWEARFFERDTVGMWRDFTPAELERLGEIQEVKYTAAKTLMLMGHDLEVARYFEWLSGTHSRLLATPDMKVVEAREGLQHTFLPNEWVQVPEAKIPGTNVARYGALAGRYLPAAIWNDVRQVARYDNKPFGDTYDAILRFWKVNKTARSPVVHANNILGNFMMMDAADVGARHLYRALQAMVFDAKNPEHVALLREFEDAGATQGMFVAHELRGKVLDPLMEDLRRELGEADSTPAAVKAANLVALVAHGQFGEAAAAIGQSRPAGWLKRADDVLIKAYEKEDVLFRLAAYIKAREEGADANAAGAFARERFLNYSINAPYIQLMRQSAWPFIGFTYRALPMLLETYARKPWKLMKIVGVAAIANSLAYSALGLDDDDEDRERALLPEEKSGRIWGLVPKLLRMPWNDAYGQPVFLDIRRWVVLGDIADVGQRDTALPMTPAIIPGGPMAVLGELFLNKVNFTGKPITRETDTAWEQARAVGEHLYKSLLPNAPWMPGSYSATGLLDAGTGKTDVFGREQSPGQAIASAAGIKLASYPRDVMQYNAAVEHAGQQAELSSRIRSVARQFQRKAISDEDYQEAIADLAERKRKLAERFARRTGAIPTELEEQQ